VCIESEGRERRDASEEDEDHQQQRKGHQKERDGIRAGTNKGILGSNNTLRT
jgi:hypothetical protein